MSQTQNVAQRTRRCIISLFPHDPHTNPFSMPSETLQRDQRLYVHSNSGCQSVKWDAAWDPPRRMASIPKSIQTDRQDGCKFRNTHGLHLPPSLTPHHSSCISMFLSFKRCCSVYCIIVIDGGSPMVTCCLSSPCPQHRRNEVNTHKGLVMVPGHQEVLQTKRVAISAIILNENCSSPSSLGPHMAYLWSR